MFEIRKQKSKILIRGAAVHRTKKCCAAQLLMADNQKKLTLPKLGKYLS